MTRDRVLADRDGAALTGLLFLGFFIAQCHVTAAAHLLANSVHATSV